jgi:hypothetical protein
LVGYYRRFIEGFSKIARPMMKLLQKDQDFGWTNACERSFCEKERLITSPMLILPDICMDFIVWLCTHARRESCSLCLQTVENTPRKLLDP